MGGFQNRPPREICNFCRPELHEKKFLDSLRGERAKRKSLDFSRLFRVGGRNRTRTCDPIDVNDVLWAIGQVVKLKYGREHTSEALEIWAFLRFGLCSRCLCKGCVQLCSQPLNTGCSAVFTAIEHGVFRCVQGVFTTLLGSLSAEHGREKTELEPVLLFVRPTGIKL